MVYGAGGRITITVFRHALGAACVFFLKDELNRLVQKGLLGFASGVMVAASVWSLLIPAIDMAGETMGKLSFVPAAVGFVGGIFFLLRDGQIDPASASACQEQPEGMPGQLKRRRCSCSP